MEIEFNMRFWIAVCLLAVASCHAHHNGTCEEETKSVRECMWKFFQTKFSNRSVSSPEDVEKCFTSNGCQKPLTEGQQLEADMELIKGCKQRLHEKSRIAMDECVQDKSPDHWTSHDEENNGWQGKKHDEKRDHCKHWAFAKQTQDITICPVSANGDKVRTCLRDLVKRKFGWDEKANSNKQEFCDAKIDCLKDISDICREHMKLSRGLRCQCAKERMPPIKQEFFECVGVPVDEEKNGWDWHHCSDDCEKSQ